MKTEEQQVKLEDLMAKKEDQPMTMERQRMKMPKVKVTIELLSSSHPAGPTDLNTDPIPLVKTETADHQVKLEDPIAKGEDPPATVEGQHTKKPDAKVMIDLVSSYPVDPAGPDTTPTPPTKIKTERSHPRNPSRDASLDASHEASHDASRLPLT